MSLANLATVGTLTYNGIEFDGSSTVNVQVEFIYDDAERTKVYEKYVISVHGFVHDPSSTDTAMHNIRDRLSEPGKALLFINKGFGDDLAVNAGGQTRDVKWGPTPKKLSWQPVGAALTGEIEWEVEVCVHTCGTSLIHRSTGVMAVNYSVAIHIDNRGLSQRVVSGYLEIANTRLGRQVPDSADNYRQLIQPPLPGDGYTRDQQWDISANKSRIEFSITDTQIPSRNAYPQNTTNIEAHHRMARTFGRNGSAMMRGQITCDLEMPLGANIARAWQIFGGIVAQRFDHAKRSGCGIWLDEVVADENIFGLDHSFSCSYRLLMDLEKAQNSNAIGNPADFIARPEIFDFQKTGLWQPLGTEWRYWRTSLVMGNRDVFGQRGLAGLSVPNQQDAIVDLCGSGASIPWSGQALPDLPRSRPSLSVFKNERPAAHKSWVSFNQRVIARRKRKVSRQSPMGPPPESTHFHSQDTNGFNFGAGVGSPGSQTQRDTIQESGNAAYSIGLVGSAYRAGYEIPKPSLVSVGGRQANETDTNFACDMVGIFFGVPLFRAVWACWYMLDDSPGRVGPTANIQN